MQKPSQTYSKQQWWRHPNQTANPQIPNHSGTRNSRTLLPEWTWQDTNTTTTNNGQVSTTPKHKLKSAKVGTTLNGYAYTRRGTGSTRPQKTLHQKTSGNSQTGRKASDITRPPQYHKAQTSQKQPHSTTSVKHSGRNCTNPLQSWTDNSTWTWQCEPTTIYHSKPWPRKRSTTQSIRTAQTQHQATPR